MREYGAGFTLEFSVFVGFVGTVQVQGVALAVS